jgi:hypothetical protein
MSKGKPQTSKSAPKPAPTGNPGTTTNVGPKPSSTTGKPTGNQGSRGIK